nr:hypothetical protein [uncultured archaeon]
MANWWDNAPVSGGDRNAGQWWAAAPLVQQKTFERNEDEQLYRDMLRENLGKNRPLIDIGSEGLRQHTDEEIRNITIERVQSQRAREAEEKAFRKSRTPLRRASETADFILSAPVRALTKGKYGIADVYGLFDPEAGAEARQQEANFVRANQGWLEPVAQAGEASLGIPVLGSMGAVPGQMLRSMRGAVTQALPRQAPRATVPAATAAQAYGPAERIIDRAAFQAEGIPEFPPAFASKGTARFARTIEETPLVGGTVRVPKNEVEMAMAARQQAIAQQAGAAGSAEDVGLIAQRGLGRFRGAQLQNLERQEVAALRLPTDRPQQRRAGYVTVDRPSQLSTANMTEAELHAAARAEVNLPGSTRARVEDLSPAEVQRIVDLPARDTSFATKASALYRQADDALPPIPRIDRSANPGQVATRNSGTAVRGMLAQEGAAEISGGVLEGRFGNLVRDLANPQRNFTLSSLRAARTEIGRALSSFGDFDTRLDRTQLKQLYAALSEDYQQGLVAIAARARRNSRLAPTASNYVSPALADAADRALYRYRVADRYYRAGIERMDRFMQVLGADTLEQASRRIGQYLRENTQNIRALESVASSLRPEEWRSVLGHVIEGLGRLTPGAREAERIFSFERFATDWNKISQNPRTIALFRRGLGNEVVTSLQNLGRIAERMKRYETTRNYSGSGYVALGGAGLASVFSPQTLPLVVLGMAGTGVAGKILTSRSFAGWVNSLNRAQLRVGSSVAATSAAMLPHIRRLGQIATRSADPEVAAVLQGAAVLLDRQLREVESYQSPR